MHHEQFIISASSNHQPSTSNELTDTDRFLKFPFLAFFQCRQVVNCSILYHGQEDEDETDPEVNVHGFDVGHSGHGGVDSSDDGGHGEHRGDAWAGEGAHTQRPFRPENASKKMSSKSRQFSENQVFL